MSIFYIYEIIIIVSSIAGFFIALYIAHKKSKPEPMVCPLNFDCKNVITSDYSKFFGIPVEKLGLVYYGLTAILHIAIILGIIGGSELILTITAVASSAFIFSIYLIAVQAVVIKEWCTWCIFSAIISAIIFVGSALTFGADLFNEWREFGFNLSFKIFMAVYIPLLLVMVFGHKHFGKKPKEQLQENFQ